MNLLMPDAGLLFWMTIIFVLLFIVLARFGFPVITKMVDKRSKHIDESLAAAQEAQLQLQNLAQEQRQLLESTRQEQTQILKDASQARDRIVAEAQRQARDEAAKILEAARVQIEAEKQSALSDIRRQSAMLSVEIAEKILRKNLSSDASQAALIDRMLDEVDAPQGKIQS